MFTGLRQCFYWLLVIAMVLLVVLFAQQAMAQTAEVELTGILEQVGDGFIVVSGQTISITGAEIKDPLTVGATVKVHFSMVNGQAVAREVENAADDDDLPADCAPTRPAGWVTYVIRADDTLSGIAVRTGSRVEELARVNCIANRRLIRTGAEIFVPLPIDDDTIEERCRLNGIEPERCRALFFGDDDEIAERCRLNGIEPERCRALFEDNDESIQDRCEAIGIDSERCRALFFGDNLDERCALSGIEPDDCRELLFGDDDEDDRGNSGPGSVSSGPGGDDHSGDDRSGSESHDDRGRDDDEDDDRDDEDDDGDRSGSNRGDD